MGSSCAGQRVIGKTRVTSRKRAALWTLSACRVRAMSGHGLAGCSIGLALLAAERDQDNEQPQAKEVGHLRTA